MLELKTKLGNFGTFKDLLISMKIENLKEIQVDSYYVFDKVNSLTLTIKDIEKIIKSEVWFYER